MKQHYDSSHIQRLTLSQVIRHIHWLRLQTRAEDPEAVRAALDQLARINRAADWTTEDRG